MIRIEFKAVSQSFHGRKIFGPLDLTLQGGNIIAITGRNGSGKSTFLKLAGHLLLPVQGKVRVLRGEKELAQAELRRRIAMVTPELKFYDRLTARENLDFFLGLRGLALDAAQYAALWERVGLSMDSTAASLVGEFSTGMRQRLKLAVLLASRADIWLLDEPGANLDEAGRSMVLTEARQAAQDGKLVLLATNDPGEEAAADVCIPLAEN